MCWRRWGMPAARTFATCTCGLVAMTSASHAEGRQFDPGQVYYYAPRPRCAPIENDGWQARVCDGNSAVHARKTSHRPSPDRQRCNRRGPPPLRRAQQTRRKKESGYAAESPRNFRKRHRGDSNPCGQSPMDFESISLTARTQCLWQTPKQRPTHAAEQGKDNEREQRATATHLLQRHKEIAEA